MFQPAFSPDLDFLVADEGSETQTQCQMAAEREK
jgi:hypothetical protein